MQTRIGEHNLARLSEEALERRGDREALFFEGRWYRTGELHERSERIGAGLADLGVEPGDRVVVFMANTPEVGLLYNAIWRAGAVATPTIFLLPPPELRHVLVDSGATTVVTTPEFLLTVQLAADGIDTLRHVVCLDPPEDADGVVDLAQVESHAPGDVVARGDDDLAALLYTGGTTGRSKGVMLSHGGLWWMGRSAVEHTWVDGWTRNLLPLPLSHAYGLGVTIASNHQPEPTHSVLMRWFDPGSFCDLVEEHGIVRSYLVPSMFQMLLTADLESRDLSTLKSLSSGAAPLAVETIHEIERRIPSVEVIEGYGLTEAATFVSANQPGDRKVGTVGRPFPRVEVRTVDEHGDDADPGEVIVRSPGAMDGYWNAPEATSETLRGGWLRTGDVGSLDEDGFLTILDRKKDLIIRGGFNVYPRDVEDTLVQHPAVAAAGVVGAPDPDKGEEVVAFVQLVAGETIEPDELVAWSRERLGSYKYPRHVHVVDQIPLTPVMKLDRKALRECVRDPGSSAGQGASARSGTS